MSGIRGEHTKPEKIVRSALWREGFRFRLHSKAIPGRPDIVLPKWRTAIFANGCFWHAHEGCKYFRVPESRREFWIEKLERNRQRDRETVAQVAATGWKCVIVWECALRSSEAGTSRLLFEQIRNLDAAAVEISANGTAATGVEVRRLEASRVPRAVVEASDHHLRQVMLEDLG